MSASVSPPVLGRQPSFQFHPPSGHVVWKDYDFTDQEEGEKQMQELEQAAIIPNFNASASASASVACASLSSGADARDEASSSSSSIMYKKASIFANHNKLRRQMRIGWLGLASGTDSSTPTSPASSSSPSGVELASSSAATATSPSSSSSSSSSASASSSSSTSSPSSDAAAATTPSAAPAAAAAAAVSLSVKASKALLDKVSALTGPRRAACEAAEQRFARLAGGSASQLREVSLTLAMKGVVFAATLSSTLSASACFGSRLESLSLNGNLIGAAGLHVREPRGGPGRGGGERKQGERTDGEILEVRAMGKKKWDHRVERKGYGFLVTHAHAHAHAHITFTCPYATHAHARAHAYAYARIRYHMHMPHRRC